MTNRDLEETVHNTSDEWIRLQTGFLQRRVLVHEGTREVVTKAEDAGEGEEDNAVENQSWPLIARRVASIKT